MPTATFETPNGENVEIDSSEVTKLRLGTEEETVIIEFEDGSEVTVVSTELEVAADLGLNPLEVIDAEDDDESIESLVEGVYDDGDSDE